MKTCKSFFIDIGPPPASPAGCSNAMNRFAQVSSGGKLKCRTQRGVLSAAGLGGRVLEVETDMLFFFVFRLCSASLACGDRFGIIDGLCN